MKEEREILRRLAAGHEECRRLAATVLPEERQALARRYREKVRRASLPLRDAHGLLRDRLTMDTVCLFAERVEPEPDILAACAMAPYVAAGVFTIEEIRADWGEDVAHLIEGIMRVKRYSDQGIHADQDNFRGLLLSLADDIRVIIIMIVENLALMRSINLHPDEKWVRSVAFEANCLYAQLAHRLGLYAIKGELEDLSLKYSDRKVYKQIAERLNATKRARDAYIAEFIGPVKQKLTEAGLKFEIKGRTKSISSIWAKIKKQKVGMDKIYDLFAIRVILDSPIEREKQDCWLAYSILADMYTANPARMRDWISIPKSNGYESLHATVMGPGGKWVEVQFRTVRMDLVAEKGLAAHWRYKGGKSDGMDKWMRNVRDILENAEEGPMRLMKDMKMDVYSKEVFAFTPKGALLRLGAGSTVLDFAFQIHSDVGCHCVGGIVNGKQKKINYKIQNGDTVEIITSTSQRPKPDWLSIVVSSKARNRIRLSLNEERKRLATLGKETLERRARNRKVEIDEAILMRLVKKEGYKYATDFFADVADEKIDAGKFLSRYVAFTTSAEEHEAETPVSAGDFKLQERPEDSAPEDILTIGDKSLRGMNYRFAKCCNPIHGDKVFGFISSEGIVKIHRCDCANAAHIRSRYPYRLIQVRWSDSEKNGTLMPATLRIVGTDDIGIVANITSIISKDPETVLRNISVDAHDGIFQGYLVLGISGNKSLAAIMRKLATVKGIKDIRRT